MLIFRHGLLLLALYDAHHMVILALAGTQKPQPPAVQTLCLHGDANEKRPNLMRGKGAKRHVSGRGAAPRPSMR